MPPGGLWRNQRPTVQSQGKEDSRHLQKNFVGNKQTKRENEEDIKYIYIYIRIYTMSHSQTVFVDDDGIILHGKVLGAHRLSVQSWRHASQLMGIIKLASNPSLTATTSSANI